MKPGTFTQLHVQLIFAVRHRKCLLNGAQRKEVFSYISGIIDNIGHKSLIVNGYADHVHIFLGLNPARSISDTVAVIKKASHQFVNSKKWYGENFSWQDGYGAFTYSRNQVRDVYNYILNQESHHCFQRFRDEYIETLKREEIPFDDRFLFDFLDDIAYHQL